MGPNRWESFIGASQVGQRVQRLGDQLLGCPRFEMTEDFFDGAVMTPQHNVNVIGQDRAGEHLVSRFVGRPCKPAADRPSLQSGEANGFKLQRRLRGQPEFSIVGRVGDGSSLIRFGCIAEAKEIPRSHEIRP